MIEIFEFIWSIWFLCIVAIGIWVSSMFIWDQLKKGYSKIKHYFTK